MHNAYSILLSEYLKWYLYKPVSYTFSQSFSMLPFKKENDQAMNGGVVTEHRVYERVDITFGIW